MAIAVLIPVSEYLRTSYQPDAEYVEGRIEERNLGNWTTAICNWSYALYSQDASIALTSTSTPDGGFRHPRSGSGFPISRSAAPDTRVSRSAPFRLCSASRFFPPKTA